MKISNLPSVALFVLFTAIPALSQETGDLKIHFEYGGDPPKPTPIDVNKDVEFCGKHPLADERLLVNEDNKGIKNVVVYVYTGRGGSDLEEVEPARNTHTLANENCQFTPHILIAQSGDTLEVTNPDAVGHNANLSFLENRPQNFTIAAGQSKSVELEEEEPAPIPVECNIHPWMRSYVVVLDHPFAAVSDSNGDLMIKGLPVGKKLSFRAFHEAGSIKEVMIDGKQEDWNRARFEMEIKPGLNDMGTVVVPADALKAN